MYDGAKLLVSSSRQLEPRTAIPSLGNNNLILSEIVRHMYADQEQPLPKQAYDDDLTIKRHNVS
jgi:hypothetical protein